MKQKAKIRAAMGILDDTPLPENTLLLVDYLVPHHIVIHDLPPSGAKVRAFKKQLASRVSQIKGTAASEQSTSPQPRPGGSMANPWLDPAAHDRMVLSDLRALFGNRSQ